MIDSVIFSPTGTSARIAGLLAESMGEDVTTYDITVDCARPIVLEQTDRLAVFAVPVYAGRVPALAAERLMQVSGKGQKAVAIAVYGNRDYDDALVELCDIVQSRGFEVIAAGAFIARHCIFPKVATHRPDAADEVRIGEFAREIQKKIKAGTPLDLGSVKGNRPYKKAVGVPLHPDVDSKLCNECGTCAGECPTGAIDASSPKHTDSEKCITCSRCIYICPTGARQFGGMLYKIAGWKFVKDNARRLEPEWFV